MLYWSIVDFQCCVYILIFFFRLFSHLGYYRILSRVPCTIQQILIAYLFLFFSIPILNIVECICQFQTPNLSLPAPPLSLLVTINLFSKSMSLCFANKFIRIIFFLDSAYKQCHITFVFLCLTQYENLQVHPYCCKWDYFTLLWLSNIPLGASLIAQLVKNLPAMKETLVQFLDWEDPLEKGQAIHSTILGLPLWLSW